MHAADRSTTMTPTASSSKARRSLTSESVQIPGYYVHDTQHPEGGMPFSPHSRPRMCVAAFTCSRPSPGPPTVNPHTTQSTRHRCACARVRAPTAALPPSSCAGVFGDVLDPASVKRSQGGRGRGRGRRGANGMCVRWVHWGWLWRADGDGVQDTNESCEQP